MSAQREDQHHDHIHQNPSENFEAITSKDHYDYIITGAGSAGCVIARRIIEHTDAKVLLLEAGGDHAGVSSIRYSLDYLQNMGSVYDYSYHYEPVPAAGNRPVNIPRGKVLGGSGSIDAMVWARGNHYDYDAWAEAGNKGWDYASVLPLFKRIEDWEDGETAFHGAGGPLAITRAKPDLIGDAMIAAGQRFGMPFLDDINGPSPEGIGRSVMNIKDGIRQTPAFYLEPVMQHKNLTVLIHAKVIKLNFEGNRCTGVDFIQNDRSYTVKASTEVIVCAGAIDTPRILMLSGIGAAAELKNLGIPVKADLPGVGHNLQDHVILKSLNFETKEPAGEFSGNYISAIAHWKSRYDLKASDLMILARQAGMAPQRGTQPKDYTQPNTFGLFPALMSTRSRGSVKMRTSRHDGPLEITGNLLSDPLDMEAMVNAIRLCFDLVSKPPLKDLISKWVIPEQQLDSRQSIISLIKDHIDTHSHMAGTCAMGSGKEAVVSDKLLVHGLEGLRIADASVMPENTTSNTLAPTLMIGEFAAKLITGK